MERSTLLAEQPISGSGTPPTPVPGHPHPVSAWSRAATGAILCILTWEAGVAAGIQSLPILRGPHGLPLAALLGALLGLTAARRLLWIFAGLVAAALLVIGYTPVMDAPMRSLVRADGLQPADAAVVLSSDLFQDGSLPAAAQSRLLRGRDALREGYARQLVLTRLVPPKPSALPAVREEMQRLRFDFPVVETPEAVTDTHDEALAIARMCRERNWPRIILVSDPSHMRRAAAVFEGAGVPVLCAPGSARDYSPTHLDSPRARIDAFRDWLHEVVGYQVYRLRGWIH